MSGGPSACGCTMWLSRDSIWLLQEAVYLFSQESGVGAPLTECDTHLLPGEVRGGLSKEQSPTYVTGTPSRAWCGVGLGSN